MSGYFDPAPRDVSVAPPGFDGPTRSTTPFVRHRAAMDRRPEAWGSELSNGPVRVPTSTYHVYEPVTHAYARQRSALPPSDPRSNPVRTIVGS